MATRISYSPCVSATTNIGALPEGGFHPARRVAGPRNLTSNAGSLPTAFTVIDAPSATGVGALARNAGGLFDRQGLPARRHRAARKDRRAAATARGEHSNKEKSGSSASAAGYRTPQQEPLGSPRCPPFLQSRSSCCPIASLRRTPPPDPTHARPCSSRAPAPASGATITEHLAATRIFRLRRRAQASRPRRARRDQECSGGEARRHPTGGHRRGRGHHHEGRSRALRAREQRGRRDRRPPPPKPRSRSSRSSWM